MNQLGRLSRQTATYFAGNIVYRGASFLLVPLYAHALSASDYGKLELIATTTIIVQAVLSSGIAHSALRFYFEYEDPKDRNAVISTALIGNFVFAGLVSLILGIWFAPTISRLVFDSPDFATAFRLTLAVIVLDISREISLAWIRARERAGLFMVVSVTQLITQVGFNVYAVVWMQAGVTGILAGNLLATAVVWLIVTTMTVSHCGVAVHPAKLRAVLRYGQPLMLSMLAASGFQFLDRFVLKSYTSYETLGAYALALRIANVFPVLFLAPFTNGYGAFRFSIMKQPNASDVYSRVVTYYTLGATAVVLALACLSRDIVEMAASLEYSEASRLVPILLLPAALGGINYCFQTGIYVTKNTRYLVYVSAMTGAVNLALVLVLTPRLGVYGPGISSLVATLYTIAHTYVLSQRVMPVQLEWKRLSKIVGVAAVLGGVVAVLPNVSLVWDLVIKAAIIASYPLLLLIVRFLSREEITAIRGVLPSGWRLLWLTPEAPAETSSRAA
jgi:O-antigen/teichoic acid export membrane protein